jgi:hypothetical protein
VSDFGLDTLSEMPLSPRGQAALAAATASAKSDHRGSALWRARKLAEARGLIALAELAPAGRMRVEYLDLSDELRAVCRLGVPAAWRAPDGEVRIADAATIGLVYPEKALVEQLHGFSYIEVLEPREPRPMWHPAVAAMGPMPQVLCLGDLPAGMRCTELVLLAYAALAMQNIRLDAFEALGVLNVPAAHYWHERAGTLPLTRRAFLEPD